MTQPGEIFFDPRGKIEKVWIFRGLFSKPKPKIADLNRPNQQKFDAARPGSKMFNRDPSLSCDHSLMFVQKPQ